MRSFHSAKDLKYNPVNLNIQTMKIAIKLFCLMSLLSGAMTGCSLYDDTELEVIECPKAGTPIDPEPWLPGEPQPEDPEVGH